MSRFSMSSLQSRQADFLYFLMVGKLVFTWFSKSINQAGQHAETNKGLMAQLNLRKEILPLAVIQQGFYRQLVVFGFLFGMLAYSGYLSALWWLLPLAVIQAARFCGCVRRCWSAGSETARC